MTEPRRILIVDDEPLARQRLRRYLANVALPFLIEEADSGLGCRGTDSNLQSRHYLS